MKFQLNLLNYFFFGQKKSDDIWFGFSPHIACEKATNPGKCYRQMHTAIELWFVH